MVWCALGQRRSRRPSRTQGCRGNPKIVNAPTVVDPAQQGNQPRFIAYEAEWQRPTFEIWNLYRAITRPRLVTRGFADLCDQAMIADHGVSTRVPGVDDSVRLAAAARPAYRGQGCRDPGVAP
ncbi:collagenase [Saccharopolyspora shandongensis]|uniref:collagenase n=1 Tax=Saccharopolyspora shandongensis TaxID=418495 RepID=UPI0034408F25